MNERAVRKALCAACSELYGKELLVSTGGNVSMRFGDGIIITPSGKNKGKLHPEDAVRLSMDGEILGNGKPSVEYKFHLALYERRPDVNAVVHCHPVYCTALAVKGVKIRSDLTPEGVILLGDVPTVPYRTPGSDELVREIARIWEYDAAIMERHGALTVGKDIEEACNRMEELEFQAHLQLVVGAADGLPKAEVEKLRGMR